MIKIAVFGAGGFGKEVAMLIEQINTVKAEYDFIGFFDDGIGKNTIINDYPCLGGVTELNQVKQKTGIILALGNPALKMKILAKINNQYIFYPSLIHPNVQLGSKKYVQIGHGCVIAAGNLITVNIRIGNHVILNLGCTVGHDVVLDDYTSVMPGVNISGGVRIHRGAFIGTGAKINNQLEIGAHTIIGAGSVVTKSIAANCTAVGVPARPIKFHNL